MATDVTMPRLSDSMEEGTVLKWLVDEGGEVKRGEPLVEIETDKANMTYEADADGTLLEIVAREGETLPIGEVIARLGEPGEKAAGGRRKAAKSRDRAGETGADEAQDPREKGEGDGAKAAPAAATAERHDREEERAEKREPAPEAPGDGRVKASPVARRLARDLGVELAELEGSGPGGRIVKADVEAAAGDGGGAAAADEAAAPAQPEDQRPERARAAEGGPKGEPEVQELTRLQQTVSRRMAESKATAPDFTLQLEADMRACLELRERLKEVADPPPSINDMVVKAAASALREFPRVNGAYRDGRFELYENVNVGIAVAAQDTLVVPTIFGADGKSLGEISRRARELIERVRDSEITPPELSGGTFTVSNLGMYGIESFTAVINPPQAALLTVGALQRKPVVDDRGRVVAGERMALSLVCDHRILYGADGARFLARVRELLERPLALAL